MSSVSNMMDYLVGSLEYEDIDFRGPTYSNNDAGESAYVFIDDERLSGYPKFIQHGWSWGIKVRVSDHSVENIHRMRDEVQFYPSSHTEKNIDFFVDKLVNQLGDEEE